MKIIFRFLFLQCRGSVLKVIKVLNDLKDFKDFKDFKVA